MAVTTIADLDSLIQVVVMDTILTARQMPVMARVVRRIMAPEKKGSPFDLPKIGKLTAYPVSEGSDYVAPQSFTDTDVSVNPTEVIVQTMVTDRMLGRAPGGFNAMISEEHSRAYAERVDLDGLALFSGFSNGLSAAGSALVVANIGAGRARVKGNSEPGPDPVVAVLHPYHLWDIWAGLVPVTQGTTAVYPLQGNPTGPGGVDAANAVLRGALASLFNMAIYEAGLITVDSGDDAYSAIFSRDAIVLAVTDEGSMRPQRDESARATELNYVGEYAFVERVDAWGYYLLNDALAPTA